MATITRGKHLPDFTDEEVWNWFGNRGVYSESVEQFKNCFDIFEHKQGIFTYRLKFKNEWGKIKTNSNPEGIFSVVLHDPMESLHLREYDDKINRIDTHYLQDTDENQRGDEIDVIEN